MSTERLLDVIRQWIFREYGSVALNRWNHHINEVLSRASGGCPGQFIDTSDGNGFIVTGENDDLHPEI